MTPGGPPSARALPRVVVVGLGPGDPGLVTTATTAAIAAIDRRFVRTVRHPSVSVLGPVVSFDEVYDCAVRLEDVYVEIVERLVEAAARHGEVLYAVPGSPLVAERTVELLRDDRRVEAVIQPAMSFLDLAWQRVGVDPVAAGVRLIDGQRFSVAAAGLRGPLLVSQCDSATVLSEVKLAVEDGPPVTVLRRLGLPDESVRVVAWDDLDRLVEPDHLTTLWIPSLAAPIAGEVARLEELMRVLRQRCPWDQRQTHQSLTSHLLEETYEVLEAIAELGTGDAGWEHLEEELGDLLFQVVFHAALAAEEGRFTLADVARGVHDKLVARHPHVFPASESSAAPPSAAPPSAAPPAAGQSAGQLSWEQIKREEKGRASPMDGIPGNLPALALAAKTQSRAASVGFDWDGVDGAWPKVSEELAELHEARRSGDRGAVHDELGDLLFAVVNVARHLGVDPEAALRGATGKFRRRFGAVEALAAARGLEVAASDLATLDGLWDEAKAAERREVLDDGGPGGLR